MHYKNQFLQASLLGGLAENRRDHSSEDADNPECKTHQTLLWMGCTGRQTPQQIN